MNSPAPVLPAGTPRRILAWNICQGGGKRLKRIFETISGHAADILVLSEYRYGTMGLALEVELQRQGYPYFSVCSRVQGQDSVSVLVAAKTPFSAKHFSGQITHPRRGDFSHRLVLARFPDFDIIGAYIPLCAGKTTVFDHLLRRTPDYLSRRTLLIGDLNTGLSPDDVQGGPLPSEDRLAQLYAAGWIDAWRSRHPADREYTWFHSRSGNGFRIDQALVSKSFDQQIKTVWYSHTERGPGISDHSALIVDLSTTP